MQKNARNNLVFASVLPLAVMAIGQIFSLYIKSTNPSNVDITSGLAYLGYILAFGVALFVIGWLVALWGAIKYRKNNETAYIANLTLTILIINTVLLITLGVINNLNGRVIDNYHHDSAINKTSQQAS